MRPAHRSQLPGRTGAADPASASVWQWSSVEFMRCGLTPAAEAWFVMDNRKSETYFNRGVAMPRSFLIAMLALGANWVPLYAQETRTADQKAVWALIESSGNPAQCNGRRHLCLRRLSATHYRSPEVRPERHRHG
jgi:hypothetical protein